MNNKCRIYSVKKNLSEAGGVWDPPNPTIPPPDTFRSSIFKCGFDVYAHRCFYMFRNVDITIIQGDGCSFKIIETNFPDPLRLVPFENCPNPNPAPRFAPPQYTPYDYFPQPGFPFPEPSPLPVLVGPPIWDTSTDATGTNATNIFMHTNELLSFPITAGQKVFTYKMTMPCDAFYIEMKNNNAADITFKIIMRSYETV